MKSNIRLKNFNIKHFEIDISDIRREISLNFVFGKNKKKLWKLKIKSEIGNSEVNGHFLKIKEIVIFFKKTHFEWLVYSIFIFKYNKWLFP